MNCIDFQKAFDSIDQEVLWELLAHCSIPPKIISLIQQLYLYESFSCQVIHGGTLTESFPVTAGVSQGCMISLVLFLLVIDWVSQTAYSILRGIQWAMASRLEDLDFADDMSNVTQMPRHATTD